MIDLDSATRQDVVRILAQHLPATETRLVGSRARGPAKRYSDIDLLVVRDTALSPLERAALHTAFEESSIPYKVDVLEALRLAPAFRDQLLRGSVVLVHRSAAA